MAPIVCYLLILISLVFSCFYAYLVWTFDYWSKRNVKFLKPNIFAGNFPKTRRGECNLVTELHEDVYTLYKKTDRFIGIFTSRTPRLFILDPKLALEILTTSFKHFRDNESSKWTSERIEQLRPQSPFVSTGDDWKKRRSELASGLTVNRLRIFFPGFQNSAERLVDYVNRCGDQIMDAKELCNRYTANVMANFIWGIEMDAFDDKTLSPIHEMANALIAQALKCVKYFYATGDFPFLRYIWPVRFFPASSDRFFKKLLGQALQMRGQDATLSTNCNVINHLSQMLEKNALNEIQIAGHTTTTLIDGFETGAIITAHCLLMLARNMRVQDKLRNELSGIASLSVLTFDELNNLPYLDQCLQESLRLLPPLTTLFKICTEKATLKNYNDDEVTLQPGDTVCISTYSFHHDSNYYESPYEFRPERFDEDLGGVRKYSDLGVFLPFGAGPRICPGNRLGLIEAKVAIANLIKSFVIRPSPRTRLDNEIAAESFLLTIKGGIELIFAKL